MLRYLTAGESHGKGLMVVIDGMPAGLRIGKKELEFIHAELKRRMHGYGRGGRMKIEDDRVEIISGLRKNITIGSPLGILISNLDQKIEELPDVNCPRPGHADLAGVMKYGAGDARDVLERASARETAARVAAGAVAKLFLKAFGVRVLSHTVALGGIAAGTEGMSPDELLKKTDIAKSPVRCADKKAEKKMCAAIDRAKKKGDTLGGAFEVVVDGLPPGIGSYSQWDRRLDGLLARALMSIPAVKAVSIGKGVESVSKKGSEVHDPIQYDRKARSFTRATNNAGGIEGGVSNGNILSVKGYMKPISTLSDPLPSVDLRTKKRAKATTERSDVSAVSACGVAGEAMIALELTNGILEKFGGDAMVDIKAGLRAYKKRIREA